MNRYTVEMVVGIIDTVHAVFTPEELNQRERITLREANTEHELLMELACRCTKKNVPDVYKNDIGGLLADNWGYIAKVLADIDHRGRCSGVGDTPSQSIR